MNGVRENDWKAFAERWRIAEKAERELTRRDPMPPRLAIELSLEMLNLYESLHGDPFVKDAISLREEEEVRQTWKRLRQRWRHGS